MTHSPEKTAFGDFQTPRDLAQVCCEIVRKQFGDVAAVVEPTCGLGAFVLSACQIFPNAQVVGYEINDSYLRRTRRAIKSQVDASKEPVIRKQNFFAAEWNSIRDKFDGSVLFLGNPPWVTNSQLGILNHDNLPKKSNKDGSRGIDAMTGRSNFDISESIVLTLLDCMRDDKDCLAMLIKTATARKVIASHWQRNRAFAHASIRRIDSSAHFDVNVDACLLMLAPSAAAKQKSIVCWSSDSIDRPASSVAFGWHDSKLVACPKLARQTDFLVGEVDASWRSGIKHDAARVLELSYVDGELSTRSGQIVDVEPEVLYPLAKGADVANERTGCPSRRLLVTQHSLAESSNDLATKYPKAYRYLMDHQSVFASRKSSIYRGRDQFALFGIGPYTFQPWKIAICGLYKRLQFTLLGPVKGRPVVTDDTCYSLSFDKKSEAAFVLRLLQSDLATDFFEARIFWDAKRPITAALLKQLSLSRLAKALKMDAEYQGVFPKRTCVSVY